MTTKPLRWICLLALAISANGQAPPPRDWSANPAVVRIEASPEIFAIGDVHGDVERLAQLLAGAKIVDRVPIPSALPHWTAGKSVLVFTGDLIDKGPNSLGVLALVRSMREQARQAGGKVIILMGNHEAALLADPHSELTADFAAESVAAGINPKDLVACRGEVAAFLCSLPFAARVGDWFFSHGGNSGGRTLDQLASALQQGFDKDGFKASEIAGENSILFARIGDRGPHGKSWFEAESPKRDAQKLLENYAASLGVSHIVEGHHRADATFSDGALRKPGEMFQWRGLLFLIDTGLSRQIDDSRGAVLHIDTRSGQASTICPNGESTAIWDTRHGSQTGSAKPCK